MAKRPAFLFYPGDWLKDANLRRCSHNAKGVMIDLMCLMFECEDPGFLATAGIGWTDQEICRAIGGDSESTASGYHELLAKGAIRRSDDGIVYCSMLVRGEQLVRERRASGKAGANARWNGKPHGKAMAKGMANDMAKPCLSSSVSISKETPTVSPPSGGVGGIGGDAAPRQKPEADLFIDPLAEQLQSHAEKLNWAAALVAKYPRKVGVREGERAAAEAIVRVAAERGHGRQEAREWLMGKVERFAASPAGQRGVWVPYPKTWFNESRYNDDESEWQKKGDKPSAANFDEAIELKPLDLSKDA